MARPLRVELPGAVYHVTSRGNRREPIFRDDGDRAAFLSVVGRVCVRFRWSCHAYCLMTNHYHLVVETAEANLSRGMRQLNGVYTEQFNRAHQCVGHVYQGRYSAILVQRERHLVAVMRYVMLNPVRARMVGTAADWLWSSYRTVRNRAIAEAFASGRYTMREIGEHFGVHYSGVSRIVSGADACGAARRKT